MESEVYTPIKKNNQKTIISRDCVLDFFKRIEDEVKFLMDRWGYKNLEEYVNNVSNTQKTQTKTKLISNFYENFLRDTLIEYGYKVEGDSDDGYDIVIDDIKYEVKLTLSDGNTWTGNSFSKVKVENVILIKLDFDENCNISDCFFATLKMVNSIWKGDTEKGNSAFSTLSIVKEDIDNLNIIFGSVKVNKVNLGIIKENYIYGK